MQDSKPIVISDSQFREMLCSGCEQLGYSDLEMAILLEVSRPTVTRWKAGTTVPRPLLRAYIVKKISETVLKGDIASKEDG